jgi:hypothetical protein
VRRSVGAVLFKKNKAAGLYYQLISHCKCGTRKGKALAGRSKNILTALIFFLLTITKQKKNHENFLKKSIKPLLVMAITVSLAKYR